MNHVKFIFKMVMKFIKHFIPQPLPNGMAEFEKWSQEILESYNFPQNDSLRFTLSSMVMQMDHERDRIPYRIFSKRIKKAMANQVAGSVMQDLKQKQAEARALEEKEKALREKESSVESV